MSHNMKDVSIPMYPKVSIIIPVYNGGGYIYPLCKNLNKIDYPNLEIIFIDDGSDGRSEKYIDSFLQKGWLLYHNVTNQGIRKTIFKGIQEATGEYVFICSVDDRIDPNGIKRLSEDIKRYPPGTHLAVSCLLVKDGVETGTVWAHNYNHDVHNYIVDELLAVCGKVSNAHTLINRNDLLKAYTEVDEMLIATKLDDIRFAEDMLVTDYMILTGLIKKVIPVFYTFNYFETGNESAISKDKTLRIKDLPIPIAYSFVKLSQIYHIDDMKKLYESIEARALNNFGHYLGTQFMSNLVVYINKIRLYYDLPIIDFV